MMNNCAMEIAWKTLYNEKDPPYEKDRKNSEGKYKENYCSTVMNHLPEIAI